jgi:hypothetical protein
MKKIVILLTVLLFSTLFFTCDGAGSGGGSDYYISYDWDGGHIELTVGLDETDGIPHGEVFRDYTYSFAADSYCDFGNEPDRYAILMFEGDTTGSGLLGTINYTDSITPDNSHADLLVVNVTEHGPKGSSIAGTFTGTGAAGVTITNGSFRVIHNELGFLPL